MRRGSVTMRRGSVTMRRGWVKCALELQGSLERGGSGPILGWRKPILIYYAVGFRLAPRARRSFSITILMQPRCQGSVGRCLRRSLPRSSISNMRQGSGCRMSQNLSLDRAVITSSSL